MIEGQAANPDIVREAQRNYTLCLNALYEFSRFVISASLVHRLFESLQSNTRLFDPLRKPESADYQSGSSVRSSDIATPVEVNGSVIKRSVGYEIVPL